MKETQSSRFFFLKSIGLSAAAVFIGCFGFSKKKTETVRMLTQDGRLVQIDKNHLPHNSRKITEKEIHTWITSKNMKTN